MNRPDIENLIGQELFKFKNDFLREAFEKIIVEPYEKMLWWGWTEPYGEFSSWVIADLQIRQVGVAHSKAGFGKDGNVWGLIFLTDKSSFGADYSWYKSLEELAIDSGYWDEKGNWIYQKWQQQNRKQKA